MKLTLAKPDLARHLLNQQGKMKKHHNMPAKLHKMAIGYSVLDVDHHISPSATNKFGDSMLTMFCRIPPTQTPIQNSVQAETTRSATQPASPPDPKPQLPPNMLESADYAIQGRTPLCRLECAVNSP